MSDINFEFENIRIDFEATCRLLSCYIKASGYTDKELAMVLGTTVQSVNKWRHAHNLPDIDNLYALSRMFGIGLDDLILPNVDRYTTKRTFCNIRHYAALIRCLIQTKQGKQNLHDGIPVCEIRYNGVDGIDLAIC
ncbi:MAG: helix-turn-helix transcriptional regulator [Butyrivibrio sp.]|nr:helix-turn-helix transcriptional regulator [Butyrivibrio sp.]